jgi:hypothetical protein
MTAPIQQAHARLRARVYDDPPKTAPRWLILHDQADDQAGRDYVVGHSPYKSLRSLRTTVTRQKRKQARDLIEKALDRSEQGYVTPLGHQHWPTHPASQYAVRCVLHMAAYRIAVVAGIARELWHVTNPPHDFRAGTMYRNLNSTDVHMHGHGSSRLYDRVRNSEALASYGYSDQGLRVEIAHGLYEARRTGQDEPIGSHDKQGRWYPDDYERQSCCSAIRNPSRAHPHSLRVHCSSAVHLATLFAVTKRQVVRGEYGPLAGRLVPTSYGSEVVP